MRPLLIDAVEVTACRVTAFLSGSHIAPDVSVEPSSSTKRPRLAPRPRLNAEPHDKNPLRAIF
jgi:hypothetical protein